MQNQKSIDNKSDKKRENSAEKASSKSDHLLGFENKNIEDSEGE